MPLKQSSAKRRTTTYKVLLALLSTITGTGVVVSILLLVIWWTTVPGGVVRLALDMELGHPAVARRAWSGAEARMERVHHHHTTLSEMVFGKKVKHLIPRRFVDGPTRLRRIIDTLKLPFGDDSWLSGGVDLLALLENLHTTFGYTDHFLEVKETKEKMCQDPEAEPPCWSLVVSFYTGDDKADGFAGTVTGTEGVLADDLAVFVMRGLVNIEGTAWRTATEDQRGPPPFLFAESIPETMKDLAATSTAFSILKAGCLPPGQPRWRCLQQAQTMLTMATARPGVSSYQLADRNPVASLGLAFLSLRDAIRHAKRDSPGHTANVADILMEVHNWLGSLEFSRYFWATLKHPGPDLELPFLFHDMKVARTFLLDPPTRDVACALRDYRRADWASTLQRMVDPKHMPRPLRPYLYAAQIDARLRSRGGRALDSTTVSDLRGKVDAYPRNQQWDPFVWPLRFVLWRQMCRATHDDKTARTELELQLIAPPLSPVRRVLSSIESHVCRGEVVDKPMAEAWFESLQPEDGSHVRKVLSLELVRHLVRADKLKLAMEYVDVALHLPWARKAFNRDPDFYTLRNAIAGRHTAPSMPTPDDDECADRWGNILDVDTEN